MLVNAVIYFVLYLLVLNTWDSFRHRGEVMRLVTGLRPRHAAWALLTLVSTLFALGTLGVAAALGPAWLRWSWFHALTGQTGTALSAGAATPHTAPLTVVIGMYALLVLSMPWMVLGEEKVFRRGAERRGLLANAGMAVAFGAVHIVVGFPVFAALALTALGAWLTLVYRRAYRRQGCAVEATLEASRTHLANNLIAVGAGVAIVAAAGG
jgi:hypothetical protein